MNKKRSLLATCFLVSLSLHLFFLAFFARHPLILQSRFASLFRKSTPPQELITANEDDLLHQEMLEEVFEEFVKPRIKEIPFDLRFQPTDDGKQPSQEAIAQANTVPSIPSQPEAELAEVEDVRLPSMVAPSLAFVLTSLEETENAKEEEVVLPQLALEKRASTEPNKILTSSFALDDVEELDDLGLDSMPAATMSESSLPSISLIESFAKEPSLDVSPELQPSLDTPVFSTDKKEKPRNVVMRESPVISLDKEASLGIAEMNALPELDAYELPQVAQARPWDDAYDVKVQLMPHPDGKGYVFSLNLIPTEEIEMDSMTQNYYFLIDRTSSIERHRFAAYKRGVLKALSCLQPGDKFNIILFDKKIRRLNETTIPFSKAAVRSAEEFLEKQEYGGAFASADPYSALSKILPSTLSEDEMHTAILITDGGSPKTLAKHQKNIVHWINKNEGKIIVHAAAVGQANNLIMLDLLTSCSGGKLLYSDTHAAFPRKLGKLLLDQRNPMIKDLTVTATPKDKDAEVLFYPSSAQLPTLFAQRPYEIVGTIDSYSDFTVLIQGKYKNQWVSITKDVSLKKSANGPRLLDKRWAKVQAKRQYESFLKEGKVAHLLKAKELLKSSGNEQFQ